MLIKINAPSPDEAACHRVRANVVFDRYMYLLATINRARKAARKVRRFHVKKNLTVRSRRFSLRVTENSRWRKPGTVQHRLSRLIVVSPFPPSPSPQHCTEFPFYFRRHAASLVFRWSRGFPHKTRGGTAREIPGPSSRWCSQFPKKTNRLPERRAT